MSAIDDVLSRNERYELDSSQAALSAPPTLHLAVVTCMDARLDVHGLLGLELGEAHVIRNAGGAVTDDAIRSLLISQRLLGTTEVAVIHHTACGMVTFDEGEVKRAVEAETGLRPPFSLEAFSDLDGDVRQSVARVRASPFLPHTDAVRGFVYDVATGRLREVT